MTPGASRAASREGPAGPVSAADERQESHPLAMLTAEEIEIAVDVVRATGRLSDAALFAHVVLHEPGKDELARWQPGARHERLVRVQIVPGPDLELVEAIVSVTRRVVVEWQDIIGMRPTLL